MMMIIMMTGAGPGVSGLVKRGKQGEHTPGQYGTAEHHFRVVKRHALFPQRRRNRRYRFRADGGDNPRPVPELKPVAKTPLPHKFLVKIAYFSAVRKAQGIIPPVGNNPAGSVEQ